MHAIILSGCISLSKIAFKLGKIKFYSVEKVNSPTETMSVFTNHSLSSAPRFSEFRSTTLSDWPNGMV